MTLPTEWKEAKLGDLLDVVSGFAFKSDEYQSRGHFLVRIGNVQDGEVNLCNPKFVSLSAATKRFELSAGDILTSLTGNIGRVAKIESSHLPAALNQRVAKLQPAASLADVGYLYRFLSSVSFRDSLCSHGQGAAQQNVSPKVIEGITIPLPPEAEQQRIVEKVDALAARLARARVELDRVSVLASRIRNVAATAAFTAAPHSSATLANVLTEVRYGTAQKCGYEGQLPVLRIPNVKSGAIDLQDLKYADFDDRERAKLALELGDVLVIRSNGSVDLVGRAAVVDDRAVGMLYAGYLIRLRPDLSQVRPEYLNHFLSAPSTRAIIEAAARSTSGVNNVNAQQLQNLRMPLPTLREQTAVIEQLDKAFARANRLEAEAARARALLDRLESAILAKAFRGELVPQDPNDEPASVLLDRIRAERAAAPKSKRGRRAAADA